MVLLITVKLLNFRGVHLPRSNLCFDCYPSKDSHTDFPASIVKMRFVGRFEDVRNQHLKSAKIEGILSSWNPQKNIQHAQVFFPATVNEPSEKCIRTEKNYLYLGKFCDSSLLTKHQRFGDHSTTKPLSSDLQKISAFGHFGCLTSAVFHQFDVFDFFDPIPDGTAWNLHLSLTNGVFLSIQTWRYLQHFTHLMIRV